MKVKVGIGPTEVRASVKGGASLTDLDFSLKDLSKSVSVMIIVPIKENETIDKALKKFKKKFEKTGIVKQLRSRQAFEKPSVTRRTEIKKAIYKNTLISAVQA